MDTMQFSYNRQIDIKHPCPFNLKGLDKEIENQHYLLNEYGEHDDNLGFKDLMDENPQITNSIKKSWYNFLSIAGKPNEEIIDYLNDNFGQNFHKSFKEGETVTNDNIVIKDGMIKAGIWSILSKEQCQTIKTSYIETEANEIHFHCVGSAYEVLCFKESGVFSKEEMPHIEAYDKNYMSETKYLPFISNIRQRNITQKITDTNTNTNTQKTDRRILVVVCNPVPSMNKDIIKGMVANNTIYAGLLIIGEVMTGRCISADMLANLSKCKWTFKNFWHEPGISYDDFNYNRELTKLRKKFCRTTHNISQILFVNNDLINFDNRPFVKDTSLYYKIKGINSMDELIFLILYHIHALENYGVPHYLNDFSLDTLSANIKKYINELPTYIIKRYFTALRKHKKLFKVYYAFYSKELCTLFGPIFKLCYNITTRTDITLRMGIFERINVTFKHFIDIKRETTKKYKKELDVKYNLCEVCYSEVNQKCKKCNVHYCDMQCAEIDEILLNHSQTCEYNLPLKLSLTKERIPLEIINWKESINDGTFKKQIVKICSDIKSEDDFKFIVNDTIQDSLTIQNCKDMIDNKIIVNMYYKP